MTYIENTIWKKAQKKILPIWVIMSVCVKEDNLIFMDSTDYSVFLM